MSEARAASEAIDLKAIFQKLAKKWWLFAITCTLAVACAVAYLKTTPKKYAVTATLLMSEKKRNSFGGSGEEFLRGSSLLKSGGDIEDQISLLTSHGMLMRTMKSLDFGVTYYEEADYLRVERYEFKPFIVKLDTQLQVLGVHIQVIPDRAKGTYRVKAKGEVIYLYNPKDDITLKEFVPELDIDQEAKMGEPFRHQHLGFRIEFPEDREYRPDHKYTFMISSVEGSAGYYRGRLGATPLSDESNIVTLTTTGEVAQKQMDFLNALMKTYIDTEQDRQDRKGLRTIAFIDEQLGDAQENLTEAERGVQQAQGSAGVVGDAGARGEQLFTERSRLQSERARVQARVDYLRYIIQTMEQGSGTNYPMAPSASSVDVPVLNQLITEYNKDVNDLTQRNLTERQITAPTAALRRKVQTEAQQITSTAQGLLVEAQTELQGISNQIGGIAAQQSALPAGQRQLQIASRTYELRNELYTYLAQKRAEAQIAVASDQVDKLIVDKAMMAQPGPVAPDKKTVLAMAIAIGILIPLLLLLVRDFFNDRIADLEELKRLSPLPVLSTIPASKRKRILPDEPKSLLAESFRTARINLQYLNPGQKKQVVGFTSSSSGEGKTFCAINLATVIAMSGKRTVLVDADMRRPRVAEYMNVKDGLGLSTFLIGEATLADVTRHSDIPGLDVITAGPVPPNPLELVEQPRLTELFEQLRAHYDTIIVDSSPLGLVSEFVVLLRHMDVGLYVVREGHTRRGQLRLINEMYAARKVAHVDLLLNDVTGDHSGYGYYTQ